MRTIPTETGIRTPVVMLTLSCNGERGFGPSIGNVATDLLPVGNSRLAITIDI